MPSESRHFSHKSIPRIRGCAGNTMCSRSIRATVTRKGSSNMKEYKLQGHWRPTRVGTNRRKGFADSYSDARGAQGAGAQKSRRAFNTASCTYRSGGKLVFPHSTDRPTNCFPFPALTYYPSTFCRTTSFLFPGSQRRNTATDIALSAHVRSITPG